MVKTMPTKAAVNNATDRVLGPTSFSCSSVFLLCTLPATCDVISTSALRFTLPKLAAQAREGSLQAVDLCTTLQDPEHCLASHDQGCQCSPQPFWWFAGVHPTCKPCMQAKTNMLVQMQVEAAWRSTGMSWRHVVPGLTWQKTSSTCAR